MIHGNSKDPVLVKKISLHVWLLKDEVKSVLKDKLEKSNSDISKIPLDDLKSEYISKDSSSTDSDAEIVSADNLDTGEDEMAAAIAEAEAEEAAKAEEADAPEQEEGEAEASSAEEDMAAAMLEGQVPTDDAKEEDIQIGYIQRRPKIEDGKLYKGRTFLSEVDINNMHFFCNQKFMEGQSIVIEFLIPQRFVLNAEVIYCRQYNLKSRIISENKLSYRVVIKWTLLKEGEKTLLRKFLHSVEPDIPEEVIVAKPAASSGGGDDDDFDELDDLDL